MRLEDQHGFSQSVQQPMGGFHTGIASVRDSAMLVTSVPNAVPTYSRYGPFPAGMKKTCCWRDCDKYKCCAIEGWNDPSPKTTCVHLANAFVHVGHPALEILYIICKQHVCKKVSENINHNQHHNDCHDRNDGQSDLHGHKCRFSDSGQGGYGSSTGNSEGPSQNESSSSGEANLGGYHNNGSARGRQNFQQN